MKQEIRDYVIEKLNELILTAKQSGRTDELEKLIIIKEKVLGADSKSGILKILSSFWDFFN